MLESSQAAQPTTQTRVEEHRNSLDRELRKKGITGSEIAAVVGLSPYKSPHDVWAEKIGLEDPQELGGENIERGIYLEPSLIRWTAERVKLTPRHAGTMQSEKHPLIIATPDAILHSASGTPKSKDDIDFNVKLTPVSVCEVKAPGPRTSSHWTDPTEKADGIPDYYYPQVCWEMAAAGLEKAVVGALVGGSLWVYEIQQNQELLEVLTEAAEAFWENHILKEVPPLVERPQDTKWIKAWNKKQSTDELLRLDGDIERRIAAIARDYAGIHAQIKTLEDQEKTLYGQIIEAIGGRLGIAGNGWKATYKQAKAGSKLDPTALIQITGATPEQVLAATKEHAGARRLLVKIEDSHE